MNLKLIEYIKTKKVITKSDIKKIIQCKDNYAYLVIQRLLKRKILKKIFKGKYTTLDNPILFASEIEIPAYISLLTASQLKGFTEQIINNIQIITTKNKSVIFNKYKISLIKNKKIFGYEKTNEYFIATNEKLLIDMILLRNKSGNFTEIIKIIKNAEINETKMIKFLKEINNYSLIKRIGFLLEHFKGIDIYKKFQLDNNYVYLDQLIKTGKLKNTKWRIKYDFN